MDLKYFSYVSQSYSAVITFHKMNGISGKCSDYSNNANFATSDHVNENFVSTGHPLQS